MKASKKVFVIILLVAVFIGLSGHLLLKHTQSVLRDRIGEEIYLLAQYTMESLDRMVFLRIEEVQVLAHGLSMVEHLEASNREFATLPDREKFIERLDRDWQEGKTGPEIEKILNNSLSRAFSQKRRFLQQKYGVDVFSEIFATNRYGALIAASPRTTDYDQADEDWYQRALAEEEVWVEDVHYDQSTDTHSLSVVILLKDDEGKFAGLIKAGINIESVRNVLDEFQADSNLKSLNYYLVDERGSVIMSGLGYGPRRLDRKERAKPFGADLSRWAPVVRSLQGENGYLFTEEEGGSLVAWERSKGFKNYDGLNWSLVIEVSGDEVLEPVSHLEMGLGGIWGLTLFLALVIGGAFVYSVVKPVEKLTRATDSIRRGEWDVDVSISGKSSSEVDTLSQAFKKMADSLRKQLELLETQVATKTQELTEAKWTAEEASRFKSLFISNLSHEIRTPLNAVLGYAQILEKDQDLNPTQKAKVQAIYRSGNHLLRLIEDVMDISKIEAGKQTVHRHDFDLNALLWELDSHFGTLCREKGLEWKMEGYPAEMPLPVHGDEQKIRQVLNNLLGNAVKFTEAGKVELRVQTRPGNQYLFEVIDTGPGIPEDKQSSIFDVFEQAEQGVRKGGTGLGLAISKRLVQLMGGELYVVSQVGQFSRFYFVLTLPPAKSKSSPGQAGLKKVVALAQGSHVRVLVVDDDEVHLEIVQELLSSVGVEVRTARSARQGLDLLDEFKPDILFVDYRMPLMDGLDMVRAVCEKFGTARPRIVILSASVLEEDRTLFMDNGADACLGKPLVREELLDLIRRLLNVEFVYDSPDPQVEPEPEDLIDCRKLSIPPDLLNTLKDHARKGLLKEFEELLSALEKSGSEEKKLAKKLRDLAEKFDKQAILEWLARIDTENPSQ